MVALPMWLYDNGGACVDVPTVDPKALKWAKTILRTYRMIGPVHAGVIGELVGCTITAEALKSAGGESDHMGGYVLHNTDHAVYIARSSALNALSLKYSAPCDGYRKEARKLWRRWQKEDNR